MVAADADAAAFQAYDNTAREVAAWSKATYINALQSCPERDRWDLVRMRWRHRLDEFADEAMRPILGRRSVVSDPGELDEAFYGLPVHRVGFRPWTTQRIVMTGRGVGKTTRQKIRAFHGLVYGCRRVSVAIGQSDPDAVGWIAALRDWIENPSDELRAVFPELRVSGDMHNLGIASRFGLGVLLARGWRSSLRGLNELTGRPDALDLDDVESEDSSRTERSRDANQLRLTAKVLPLVPLEGGAEVWWSQTPVHHDAVAVRAWRGANELLGWETRRVPVLRSWPDEEQLWEQCRRIYFDSDRFGSRGAAKDAARAFYLERKAEMNEGADVLDPQRMGVFACHAKLWDVGPTSFGREYLMSTAAAGAGVLEPTMWPRFERRGDAVLFRGREYPIRRMKLAAHLDSSDGGDDGALVVVGETQGRYFVLASQIWASARLSEQVAGIPDVIAPFVALGLDSLQWEPTAGSASVVQQQISETLQAAGLSVHVDQRHSTEKKEARILATLEPLGAGGLLTLPADLPQRLISQGADFDPSHRENQDDWLDALQRSIERLQLGLGYVDVRELAEQIRAWRPSQGGTRRRMRRFRH